MRVYSRSHAVTCGVDLNGRTLYLCVLEASGQFVVHRKRPCWFEFAVAPLAPTRGAALIPRRPALPLTRYGSRKSARNWTGPPNRLKLTASSPESPRGQNTEG